MEQSGDPTTAEALAAAVHSPEAPSPTHHADLHKKQHAEYVSHHSHHRLSSGPGAWRGHSQPHHDAAAKRDGSPPRSASPPRDGGAGGSPHEPHHDPTSAADLRAAVGEHAHHGGHHHHETHVDYTNHHSKHRLSTGPGEWREAERHAHGPKKQPPPEHQADPVGAALLAFEPTPATKPRKQKKKPVFVDGRQVGADAITFDERMRMSYFQRQHIRKAMDAHDEIIRNSAPYVDSRLDRAHFRVMRSYDRRRHLKMTDRRRRPDEPYSIASSMSHNALHEWRLCMKAHEARLKKNRPVIDVVVPRHCVDYKAVADRRRERAKMIDKPPPPRATLVKKKTVDDYHADIMAAWEAAPPPSRAAPPRPATAPRVVLEMPAVAAAPAAAARPAAARWRAPVDVEAILADEYAPTGVAEIMRRQTAAARAGDRAAPRRAQSARVPRSAKKNRPKPEAFMTR